MSEFDDDDLPDQDGSSVEEFTVGYGKPPKDSRWKKGQSGNPSGRRKAVPTLGDDLISEAAAQMTINEGGRPRRIRKSHALVKAMFTHAFMGRVGTTRLLLEQFKDLGLTARTPKSAEDEWHELDEEYLDMLIDKAKKVKARLASQREFEERERAVKSEEGK